MKENNGKIAIAIVAMFVVALSIVGFTYAYFTATVIGNTEDASLKVTAGELVINYDSTNVIYARNIVPNWRTDGKSFYDPEYSISEKEFDGRIVNAVSAVSTDTYQTHSVTGKAPTANDGITENATFTIKNTGTDAAAYSVSLNVTENTLDATDSETYFHYYLYENGGESPVAQGTFKGGKETISLITDRTLAATGAENNYSLELYYEDSNAPQNDSIGSSFQAEIVVTGLGQSETTTVAAG